MLVQIKLEFDEEEVSATIMGVVNDEEVEESTMDLECPVCIYEARSGFDLFFAIVIL